MEMTIDKEFKLMIMPGSENAIKEIQTRAKKLKLGECVCVSIWKRAAVSSAAVRGSVSLGT